MSESVGSVELSVAVLTPSTMGKGFVLRLGSVFRLGVRDRVIVVPMAPTDRHVSEVPTKNAQHKRPASRQSSLMITKLN